MEIFFIVLGIGALIQVISMFVKDAAGICTACNGTGRNRYTGEKCMACMGTGSKSLKNMHKKQSSYSQSTNQQQPSDNQSPDYSKTWQSYVCEAVGKMKVDFVRQLIEQGADVNFVCIQESQYFGFSDDALLHIAAKNKSFELVTLLLDKGANVDVKNSSGATPLLYAGSAKIADLLIERGANIHHKDNSGMTALMNACSRVRKDQEIAKFLIEKGCDINATGGKDIKLKSSVGGQFVKDDGWNALMIASDAGKWDTVKLLLDRGANLTATSQQGYTALSIALQNNHVKIVDLLKEYSKKTGTEDTEFSTMEKLKKMFDAGLITKEDYDSKKREILDGLSLDKSISNTSLPLPTQEMKSGAAAENNIKEEKEQVIEISTNDNVMDSNDIKLFFLASKKGDNDMIHSLLDKGVDLNAKDKNGNTALILASSNGHKEIAKILIENKADITVKNSSGVTALDLALQNKHIYIAQLLDR